MCPYSSPLPHKESYLTNTVQSAVRFATICMRVRNRETKSNAKSGAKSGAISKFCIKKKIKLIRRN